MIERIEWLGHGSFRLQGLPLIYIDPWRVPRNAFHADLILISHDHYDHCSPADVEKLSGPNTIVIGNNMSKAVIENVRELRAWQVMNFDKASIKAVPAYNRHHPKEFGGLGFVVSVDHYDIYYAGDTDLIDDMSRISADIAILPISGTHTMTVQNAIEAVKRIKPRWVIPSHWGTPPEGGTSVDARVFAEQVEQQKLAQVIMPVQR